MLYLASDKEDVLALLIARSGIKGKEDEDAISKRKLDPYKGDKYKLPTFRISIGEGEGEGEGERERERERETERERKNRDRKKEKNKDREREKKRDSCKFIE